MTKCPLGDDCDLTTAYMVGYEDGKRISMRQVLRAIKDSRDLLKALARGFEHEASHQIGEPGPWEFEDGEPEWVEDLIACAKEAVSEMIKHVEEEK